MRTNAASGFEIVAHGDEAIDSLESLYAELHHHQVAAHPEVMGCAARTAPAAWARRVVHYREWLRQPHAVILLATQEGTPGGFALVTTAGGYDGWQTQERIGEIKDLVVSSSARRAGLGSALVDAAKAHLRAGGIDGLRLNVMEGNREALALYEKLGMSLTAVTMSCATTSDAEGRQTS